MRRPIPVLGWWNNDPPFIVDEQTGYMYEARCRCLFCGWYGLEVRELIDHFHREHGRVL